MLEVFEGQQYIGDRPISRIRLCGRRYNDIEFIENNLANNPKKYDVEFNTRTDEITLRLQTAPRSSVGDQGIDPIHIIILARDLISLLDKKIPCNENLFTIQHLNEAISFQMKREIDRKQRNVEGTEEP